MTDADDAERRRRNDAERQRLDDLWDSWPEDKRAELCRLDVDSNLPRWCIYDLNKALEGIHHSWWEVKRADTAVAPMPRRFWDFLEEKCRPKED